MHAKRPSSKIDRTRSFQLSVIPAITCRVSIPRGLARLLHGKMASGPHFQPSFSEFGPPAMYDYDMVVIGSGPSGRRAAVQFAKLGRSVLVVEKGRRGGGVSVHTGTIPSKTLRETVLNLSGWRQRGFYGRSPRRRHSNSARGVVHPA